MTPQIKTIYSCQNGGPTITLDYVNTKDPIVTQGLCIVESNVSHDVCQLLSQNYERSK